MSTAAIETSPSLRELAEQSRAWPFEEARKIVARLNKWPKEEVIFETGYGPSGLPHIGTFGEVARTSMVRHAFRVLTGDKVKTRLIAFSDDMDGLRKVPDNVPNKDMLAAYLGKPLTRIPDPFSNEYPSFGAANNARLRGFLDRFGFDYEFASSTDYYTSGRFDATLLKILAVYDEVMAIILPTLGPERRATYSPFLPISPVSGKVLQVPVIARNVARGSVTYVEPDSGETIETEITGGRVKCQWKADWAMRWVALGVDYEMAGKDLIDSVRLSGEICRALGGTPPEGFNYELFLDDNGQKISKSKGNGLTIDEWLRYASPESLSQFMYREPKAAKRLYFDVIPRHVDEYLQFLDAYERQGAKEQLSNPVWHIHNGAPPKADNPVPFAMLLSLVTASNAENADTLWGFIGRYRPGVTKQTHPHLASLVEYSINYYRDFVAPTKKFHDARGPQRKALADLRDVLSELPIETSAEKIQEIIYEIGRRRTFLDFKRKGKDGKPGVSLDWFNMLYEVLLGQEKGPRFGSFVAAYGIVHTKDMITGALARSARGNPTYFPPRAHYRLFLDETGNSNLQAAKKDPDQRYLSLTGVVIQRATHDKVLTEQLNLMKKNLFGDASVILHRRDIVTRKGVFASLKDKNLRNELNEQLANIVRTMPATILTVSVDKLALLEERTNQRPNPYYSALVTLLEQYVLWLDRSKSFGDVLAETRGKRHDAQMSLAYTDFYMQGMGTLSKDVIQSRLTSWEPKFRRKRSNIAGLQIADWLAHPAHTAFKSTKTGETKSSADDYFSTITEILESPKYQDEHNGNVVGRVRKWLPLK